jgi:hypothetical protein
MGIAFEGTRRGSVLRKQRCSTGVSLAVTVFAFPFLLVVTAFLVRAVLMAMVDADFGFVGLSFNVVLGICTAVAVVLAYIPARMIYMGLRW